MKKKFNPFIGIILLLFAAFPLNLLAGETITTNIPASGNLAWMVLAANVPAKATVGNGNLSYLIGGFIAILLMGYLVFSLLHPDKF